MSRDPLNLDRVEKRAARLELQVAPGDILRLVAEVRRLRNVRLKARQWIVNCVDPAVVGPEVKQQMLDTLDDA